MIVKTPGCIPVFTVPAVLLLLSFHWSYVQSACLSSCPSNACSWRHNPNAGYCGNPIYARTTLRQAYQGSESYRENYSARCGTFGWSRCRRYRSQYRSVTRYRTTYRLTLRCSTSCCRGYSGSGTNCQPVCSPSCSNGGTCTAPYRCSCTPQWSGRTCTTDVNECTANTHNCQQRCTNTRGGFTCSCYSGYWLSGNRYQCLDVNECTASTHNCQQRCTNTRGGFTCSCYSGYRLLGNRYQCQAVCTSACRNGGSCSAPNTCTCTSEWTGSTCTIPVCSPSCSNGGTCTAPNRCSCTPQWSGPTCTTDVNECIAGTHNCQQLCTNTRGGFTCSCYSGYRLLGNRYQCQDVNECTASTHNCQQLCTNTQGGFTCSCYSGYQLLGNRYQCQAVCTRACQNGGSCSAPDTCTCTSEWTGSTCTIPVCSPSCSNGGTCTAPSRCSCTPRWTGRTCTTDVNECTAGTHNCQQLCSNTRGGFTCSCYSGYRLLGNGYQCLAPPSSVSISGSSRIVYTNRLNLTCSASGTVDNYKWYLNNNKLTTTTSHYYSQSSAQWSDSGSYQCKACNWADCTSSSRRTVVVIDVPDAVDVSSIEVTNTTFDTISIQWTPPNNNFDSIIDYRVDLYGSGGLVGVFTPSQPMVTLVSLQPFTTYQITISARNNAGWGGKSGLRNVNTLTRDEVLASNITYSNPREGVSTYTVELRWVVPMECLTDKLEGYRLSRWPTNTTNIETTTVNRDNVSCAWNVTAIGSETYCHEWEGFSPGSQYTVSLEIVYNYSILSTGGPTNVTITIPTLPLQEEVRTVGLAVGVAVGVLLAVLLTAVVLIFVLLICRRCRHSKTNDTDTAAVYNVNKDVSGNPLETVQFKPAYGGDNYTLTDDHRYVNEHLIISKDPHCVSENRVMSQKQHYASLDLKSVQTSAYDSLESNQNSSTAISKYGDNTNNTSEYETPEKVVPQKKPSTQQTHEYANWNVIVRQHGEGDQSSVVKKSSNKIPSASGPGMKEVGKETTAPQKSTQQTHEYANWSVITKQHGECDQSSVDRKSSNKTPSTSGPGVKEVGKETTTPQKSQAFSSDVTMPTKKENISDTHDLRVPKKHEQKEKVPPPTKQRPKTNKKQPLLPPTQQSVTPKPRARPRQPNPVMTGSPSDASPKPPIASKPKKQPLLPKKVPPEQSAVAKQPPPGSNVTELRKKIENKYSVN